MSLILLLVFLQNCRESVNVQLAWDEVDGVDYYTVYRDGFEIAQTSENSYFDAELLELTEYTYSLSATNISGTSEVSAGVSITTEYTPFDVNPPTDLVATAGNGVVELTWNNPASGGDSQIGARMYDAIVFDCWLQCVDEATLLAWVGDGYCG